MNVVGQSSTLPGKGESPCVSPALRLGAAPTPRRPSAASAPRRQRSARFVANTCGHRVASSEVGRLVQIGIPGHMAQARPNHSVNLTRNSAPRWPSEARYAHNAPLVHRVTLSHAGYLKR
jgi:hypothetical protein